MHKKILNPLLLLLIFFTWSQNSFGQDSIQARKYSPIFKTNILGYFNGHYEFSLETILGKNVTLQLNGGPIKQKAAGNSNNHFYSWQSSGISLLPQLKIYGIGKKAPRGIYASIFAKYSKTTKLFLDSTNASSGIPPIINLSHSVVSEGSGGGILLGYQAISKGGISLDLFIGPEFMQWRNRTSFNVPSLNKSSSLEEFNSLGDELFRTRFSGLDLFQKANQVDFRMGISIGLAF